MIFILIPLAILIGVLIIVGVTGGEINFGGFVTLAIIEAALIAGIFAALT